MSVGIWCMLLNELKALHLMTYQETYSEIIPNDFALVYPMTCPYNI